MKEIKVPNIPELVDRPIIRNDKSEEFLNKMTDEEIQEWEKQIKLNSLIGMLKFLLKL